MVVKTIAPYGSWESPFSVDDATAGSKSLSSPRGDVRKPEPRASHWHCPPLLCLRNGENNPPIS